MGGRLHHHPPYKILIRVLALHPKTRKTAWGTGGSEVGGESGQGSGAPATSCGLTSCSPWKARRVSSSEDVSSKTQR